MALYDPVNGVYRKVTKKYDPVNGVYRKVKAAYDPVDGVYRQYFGGGELPPNTIAAGVYTLSGKSYYSQYYVDEYENYGEDTFEFFVDHKLKFTKSGQSYSCDAFLLIVDTGYLASVDLNGSYREIADYWGDYPLSVEVTISTPQTVNQHFYDLFMTAFTLK